MASCATKQILKELMKDSNKKSLLKAISWRMSGSILTFLIVYMTTGSVRFGLSIASLETFVKIFFYYIHERIWDKVRV